MLSLASFEKTNNNETVFWPYCVELSPAKAIYNPEK